MTHTINERLYLYKPESGFTLLELMIVVVIISVLSTIVIPNYHRLVAKARQSEAKTNLSTIFAAERVFQSEWGGFTGDFRDIGVQFTGRLRYDVGFAAAGWSPGSNFAHASSKYCGQRMAYNTEVSACALGPGGSQARVIFRPAVAKDSCGAGSVPTMNTFRATAIGQLGGDVDDVWTIDQSRSLCHNQPGI